MYGHGTFLVAAAALLVSLGTRAEPQPDVDALDDACVSTLEVRFDDPSSIPGGQSPDRIALFLDGKPCVEITPEGEACVMRAPPAAVCHVIPPLALVEGWCHMGSDGSWSANFGVLSSRLLADDVRHTLTAHVSTPEGATVRRAPVVVTRYSPWDPLGSSITCFQGSAAFSRATNSPDKGADQG